MSGVLNQGNKMKNLKPLVSVIIPIYNVEKYLQECLESVANQTYNNLEIILINDGSFDGSQIIAEKYIEKDKRFHLVNQDCQGVSYARNKGLDLAQGSYIMFLDSDDKIALDTVENLLLPINGKHRIFSMAKYSTRDTLKDNHAEAQVISVKGKMIDRIKAVQTSGYPSFSPWGKLYSQDVFKTLRFPNLSIHEDTSIILPVIDNVDEIVLINQSLWYYRQVKSSLTNIKISEKNDDIFEKNKLQINFAKGKHPEILNYVYMLCMNENDFVMSKCLKDKSDLSQKLFQRCFEQNREFSEKIQQRRFLYRSPSVYRVIMPLMDKVLKSDVIRGVVKKFLT